MKAPGKPRRTTPAQPVEAREAATRQYLDALGEKERSQLLDAWRGEAIALLSHQRAEANAGARGLALAFTVLLGAVTYGLAGTTPGHNLILLVLPPALALIGLTIVDTDRAAVAMGAARAEIERAYRAYYGIPVLLYNTGAVPTFRPQRKRWLELAAGSLYGAILIGFVVLTWRFVSPTHIVDGRPKDVIRHASTIKTAVQILTVPTVLAYLGAAIDTVFLLPGRAECQIAAGWRPSPPEPGRLGRRDDVAAGTDSQHGPGL